ncbi:MAG: prolipoprotein diacylglyceryl transferase [Oscillospiraceae bacterium]|nr:prolipoprotein diacylglyceryl transferase [Oscillospiraceae bacterium]
MIPSNYSKISLFGIEMNPPRGFEIGALDIRLYGIMIALGLVLAVVYGLRRRKQFGLEENDILDGVLIIVPISIICARIYYCIFEWEQYAPNPIKVLYIWEGGIAIYGAVIGAVASAAVYCHFRRIKITAALDLTVLGFLIGQSIGRWGNFFNREAVGALTDPNWFLRMGLFNEVTGKWEYFHPTFLYESVWNAIGLLGLHLFSKKRQYDGQITLLYLAWYGLGRAFIEGLRMDSLYIGAFRVSQLLAAITCLAATTAIVILALRKHDPARLYVNQVAPTPVGDDDHIVPEAPEEE